MALDVVSDVFLKLVEKYPCLRTKSDEEIRNWLYGTARNMMARHIKHMKRRMKLHDQLAKETISGKNHDWTSPADWPIMFTAISRLKPLFQDIIIMRFCQGMETLTIAEILGLNHNTLRVQLSRALALLRRELEKPFGQVE